MNRLTGSQIRKLAHNDPFVRSLAVENFLISLDPNIPIEQDMANLEMDAKLNGWNKQTVDAITLGIKAAKERK